MAELQIQRRNKLPEPRVFPEPRAFDRDGQKLEVGQEVRLLTGQFKGSKGVVSKIGKSQISIVLDSGNTTTRKGSIIL